MTSICSGEAIMRALIPINVQFRSSSFPSLREGNNNGFSSKYNHPAPLPRQKLGGRTYVAFLSDAK